MPAQTRGQPTYMIITQALQLSSSRAEASTSAASHGHKRGELKAEFLRMTADVVLFSVPYKLQSTCLKSGKALLKTE